MVFLEYLRVVKDGKRWKGGGTRWPVAGRSKEDGKREIWRDYLPWWTNELSTYSIVNILLAQLCCFPLRLTIRIEEQYWIGRNLLGNSSVVESNILGPDFLRTNGPFLFRQIFISNAKYEWITNIFCIPF